MAESEQQTLWEKREAFVNADREYKQLCDKVASICLLYTSDAADE